MVRAGSLARPAPPLARRRRANTATRRVATLDHATGPVVGPRIGGIQDNRPVPQRRDRLGALAPPKRAVALPLPPRGRKAPQCAGPAALGGTLPLPLHRVWLPRYAAWRTPPEQLGRKLRQAVTHLPLWADELDALRRPLAAVCEPFAAGARARTREVGVALPP